MNGAEISQPWWKGAIGYEVYVRSFSDANGDGVGDLKGVADRLDHIADLGADVIWLTPFYPSPMVDMGYDVSDYCGVDPLFGSLEDFDELIEAVRSHSLRLVIDLVPNHCSNRHMWFQAAIADPQGPYRDYFIWRDPGPDGGPPNNWVGYFGGSAWSLDPASGQYYLHLFLPEQPDLNWRNPAVVDEFDEIIRFWLDRGVDGFRVDVAQALVKDLELRDNPQVAPWVPDATRWEQWEAFEHRYDVNQIESLDLFARWRQIAAEYDAVIIGETYVLEPETLAQMLRGDGLDLGFWFKPMSIDIAAEEIREALRGPIEAVADPSMISFVISSHDEPRPPTRFGGGDLGRRRALMLSTLLFCLPGVPFLYQGEELGLVDGIVAEDRRADPVGADVSLSRDGCRTPIPWEPGVSFGFSASEVTWLPDGGRTDADTAKVQRSDDRSWLARYRALVALRRREPELVDGPVVWLDHDNPALVAFRRGTVVVVANTGDDRGAVGWSGDVLYSTVGLGGSVSSSTELEPASTIVIRISN
ncbi:MAG: alpha-amylase [Actinomycetia bacterium]|nr:alpha-amylase [Actinomycetes bacterium]MCP4084482.1 alpha-amylase [Actinomycetes bacterium]